MSTVNDAKWIVTESTVKVNRPTEPGVRGDISPSDSPRRRTCECEGEARKRRPDAEDDRDRCGSENRNQRRGRWIDLRALGRRRVEPGRVNDRHQVQCGQQGTGEEDRERNPGPRLGHPRPDDPLAYETREGRDSDQA